jgi:type III restriction enzyme
VTGPIHTLPELDKLKAVDFKTPLNTHVHGRVYHHFIGQISSDIGLSYEKVNTIIRQLFCELPKAKGHAKLLRLDNRSIYSFVINNIDKLRDDFKTSMTEQLQEGSLGVSTQQKNTFTFKIPQSCLFTYDARAMFQDVYSKNVYDKYLASAEIRSGPEKAFENFCQDNDSVIWFYKNGDKGTDYYSIVYEDNNGKQRNFFPDYVVGTKNGLWIIETKGGQTNAGQSQDRDPFSAKKFEALKAYIKMMQNDGRKIFGGFVRQNGIYLCICTDNYSDTISAPNWQLLKDVLR